MSDRLAEIKARHGEPFAADLLTLPRSDIDWLIAEVERLRNLVRIRELECNRAEQERDNLRQREYLRQLYLRQL
jgi:hypothetical protein